MVSTKKLGFFVINLSILFCSASISEPFLRNVKHNIFTPSESVELMAKVISKISQKDSGKCFDFLGKIIDP